MPAKELYSKKTRRRRRRMRKTGLSRRQTIAVKRIAQSQVIKTVKPELKHHDSNIDQFEVLNLFGSASMFKLTNVA